MHATPTGYDACYDVKSDSRATVRQVIRVQIKPQLRKKKYKYRMCNGSKFEQNHFDMKYVLQIYFHEIDFAVITTRN